MDDVQIEQRILELGLTAPRVTLSTIEELMSRVTYRYENPEGTTSTFAHAYLDGEFYLVSGHSACISPENFDVSVGKTLAARNAEQRVRDRLWELEGYHLWKLQKIEQGLAAKYAESGFAAYQIRVLHERDQVQDRLTKLTTFLEGSGSAGTFDLDRALLQQQQFAMQQYLSVLEQRISSFKPVKVPEAK